jgi:murein L,D-transpeptidase YafK
MHQPTTLRRPLAARLLGAALLCGLLAIPASRPARAQLPHLMLPKADLVVVHKSRRLLQLKRQGLVLRSYQVALGFQPVGHKRQEGDGRTPEGVYQLDWRNANSQFHRSIHISYPAQDDAAPAQRWGVSPGGLIMVHGLPNGAQRPARVEHPIRDWTNGCIAVTNAEIEEIWQMVDDGTTIIIYP